MIIISGHGGNHPQRLIIRGFRFTHNSPHDPWLAHAVLCGSMDYGGLDEAGNVHAGFYAYLTNGKQYLYATGQDFGQDENSGLAMHSWIVGWDCWRKDDGSGPYYGEGFNYTGRASIGIKMQCDEYDGTWRFP